MPNFHTQSIDPNIRAWFQNWTKTPADHSCHLTLHVKYLLLEDDTFFLRQQTHICILRKHTCLHVPQIKQLCLVVLISFYDLWYMKALLI